jgi:uncharacterized membrane protein HdeD (DUF308 family)
MDGKVFMCLVGGTLGLINAILCAFSPHMDWQFAVWLLFGAAFLVRAFLYWRSSHAQGS